METPKAYPATPEEEAAQTAEVFEVTEDVYRWLQLRHALQSGLQPLWRAAVSTDTAESFARGFLHPGHGSGLDVDPLGERWPDIGLQVRKLAAAMATAAGMMPLQHTGRPDDPPDAWRPLAQGECGWSVVATMRAGADVAAGQLVKVPRRDQPVEQLFMRGWTPERLCASVNGLLALDDGLISAASLLTQVASEKAKARWQAFDAGGPLQPTPGHDGIALFGLTEGDAERVRALWAPYLPVIETPENGAPRTIAGPGVAGVARLALRMVEEARQREAKAAKAKAAALEEAANRGVAVVRPVAAGMLAMSPQQTLRGIEGPAPVATIDGRVFGRIDADVAEHVHLLSSVAGLRLITWLAREGHRKARERAADPRLVQFDGGTADLRELFGGAKDTPWLDILRAGAGFRFVHNEREFSALWGLERPEDPADRRRKAIQIVILTPLLPGFVHGITDREARRLVPVLDFEPPVGRLDASKHAAVHRARYGLVVHMVDRAAAGEVEEHGGVLLDDQRWRRIASNAGLQWNDVDRMIGAWLDGDSDKAPPLIVREGNVVRLAEPHAPQWAFIVEGGGRRVKARASGQKAAAARHSDEVGARQSKRGRK